VSEPVAPFDELPEDALSAYLDGELDAAARAAVDARLAESAEWRAILTDVRSARDAVRALPIAEAPDGFWARVLADVREPAAPTAAPAATGAAPVAVDELDLARARRDRSRSRWVAALGTAAAAAVVAAVLIVPATNRVKPAVATLSNAHAVRSSASQDSVSSLAPVGVVAGFRR
jgi:anti-sigma factor RsiW